MSNTSGVQLTWNIRIMYGLLIMVLAQLTLSLKNFFAAHISLGSSSLVTKELLDPHLCLPREN